MRVEKLKSRYEIDVKFVHFPLHPDTPEEGLTLEQLFAGRNIDLPAAKIRMARLMAEEGLPYGERTMTYDSRLAQELGSWAETQGNGDRIHDALFRAYFVDNVNLAKVDHLVRISRETGLPEEEARDVLESRRFRDAVDADWRHSYGLGITGVPTFVVGNQSVTGAQPYEVLEKLIVSAGAVGRR